MIHRFSRNGVNIVCDTDSGAVHILDDVSYALCGKLSAPLSEECPTEFRSGFDGFDGDTVNEAYAELYKLYKDGALFSDDSYIPKQVRQSAPIKALCLHVSHDCNLRCKYCFAATGDFHTGRKIMDFETAKRAIDFVIERSGARRNLEVDFFGGEPLMAWDTVKKTVEYARSIEQQHNKNFRFTITTNGVLLDDEKIEYINREMSNAVLSLDGRREINDNLRIRVDGSGSYDTIVPKFQKLVASRGDKDYYVRGTFTHHNLDFDRDVLHMADLGFEQVSVEPVVSDPSLPWALQESDLEEIFNRYDILADELLKRRREGKGFNFFHFMIDLEQGPCIIKRLRGCGAGYEYTAITPEGDIYPCHQFVGQADYKLGNLYDGTFDFALSDRFGALNVYTREDCGDCWAKFYCSGGCSASNFFTNGDIAKPYFVGCELERKRVECAIYMKAVELLEKSEE